MLRDIYHDYVSYEEKVNLGSDSAVFDFIRCIVDDLKQRSGGQQVASSRMVAEERQDTKVLQFTVYFNSSYWTGRPA